MSTSTIAVNPLTGRWCNVTGRTYKKAMKYVQEKAKEMRIFIKGMRQQLNAADRRREIVDDAYIGRLQQIDEAKAKHVVPRVAVPTEPKSYKIIFYKYPPVNEKDYAKIPSQKKRMFADGEYVQCSGAMLTSLRVPPGFEHSLFTTHSIMYPNPILHMYKNHIEETLKKSKKYTREQLLRTAEGHKYVVANMDPHELRLRQMTIGMTWIQAMSTMGKQDKELDNYTSFNSVSNDIVAFYMWETANVKKLSKNTKKLFKKTNVEVTLKDGKPFYDKIQLFNNNDNNVLMNKYIAYDINKNAKTFGEIFNVKVDDYVKNNFMVNSCVVNAILQQYYEPFNKLDHKGKRMYVKLTKSVILKALEINDDELKTQDVGVFISTAVKFFIKYRLGLDIMDVFGAIIFRYRPEHINKNIFPCVLRLIILGNHVYIANDKSNFFKEVKIEEDITKLNNLYVNDTYHEQQIDLDNPKQSKMIFVNDLNEITSAIKENSECDITFVYKGKDLSTLAYDMVVNHKVVPHIFSRKYGIIDSISMYANTENDQGEKVQHRYIIEMPKNNKCDPNEPSTWISDDQYSLYNQQRDIFYDAVFHTNMKSQYDEFALQIENTYLLGPMQGHFTNKCPTNEDFVPGTNKLEDIENVYNGIDMKRAYPSTLKHINKVPVFGYFDRYEPYNNEPLDDYNMYVADVKINNIEETLLFPHKMCRNFGFMFKLARDLNIRCDIRLVRKYTKLVDVDFSNPLENLFNSGLDESYSKTIANTTIGLLEKKVNRKYISRIFPTFEEAYFYHIKMGLSGITSDIFPLEAEEEETVLLKSKLFVNLKGDMSKGVSYKKKVTRYVFMLTMYAEKQLIDGYRYVKDLVYSNMQVKLYNLYNECTLKGLNVVGVKTDCMFVKNTIKEICDNIKISDLDDYGFDKLKLEIGKECPHSRIFPKDNKNTPLEYLKVNKIQLNDEYDNMEIKQKTQSLNRVIILGSVPGVGKTTACKKCDEKALFVCWNNTRAKHLRKEGCDAMTVDHMIGFSPNDANIIKKYKKNVDVSQYKTIVFEEIFCHNTYKLMLIDMFIRRHPAIRFMANGDPCQNEPISNTPNDQSIYEKIIDLIFPNQIYLTRNKRLHTEKEQEMLQQIKSEVFDMSIPIMTTLKKYFKVINNLKDFKTTLAIAHDNIKCDNVSRMVQKRLVFDKTNAVFHKGFYYYNGLNVICRKGIMKSNNPGVQIVQDTTDTGPHIFCVRDSFVISRIDDKGIELTDEVDNNIYRLSIDILYDHFMLPFCLTGHSTQGDSYDQPLTVFECDSPYANRKWIYTAITRSRSFDQITIFEASADEIEDLESRRINLHFELMISEHVHQDKHAGRHIHKHDNYISPEWISEQLNINELKCPSCKKDLFMIPFNGNVHSNVAINIIDTNQCHHIDNCSIRCLDCNTRRSNL